MSQKTRTRGLILVTVLFAAVIALGLVVYNNDSPEYEVSTEEVLQLLQNPEFISLQEVRQGADKFLLVDLRGRDAFDKGHLEGAVNIPIHRLLKNGNLEEFEESDKTLVFYGADATQGANAWALIRQIGLTNTKALNGSYTDNMSEGEMAAIGTPQFNYKTVFDEVGTKERVLDSPPPIVQKKPRKKILPVKKAPEPEEEEGC